MYTSQYELKPEFQVLTDKALKKVPVCPPDPSDIGILSSLKARPVHVLGQKDLSGSYVGTAYALGKHNSTSEINGIVYTSNAGFIDLSIVRNVCDAIRGFYLNIIIKKAPYPQLILLANDVLVTLLKCPPTHSLFNFSVSIGYYSAICNEISLFRHNSFFGHNASFAPQNLPSILLGTILARRSFAAMGRFDDAVTDNLKKLLRELDVSYSSVVISAALDKVSGQWFDYRNQSLGANDYVKRRNFSNLPWKVYNIREHVTPDFFKKNVYLFPGFIQYEFGFGSGPGVISVGSADIHLEIQKVKKDARKKYGPLFDKSW